jgi:hypothetical protein
MHKMSKLHIPPGKKKPEKRTGTSDKEKFVKEAMSQAKKGKK